VGGGDVCASDVRWGESNDGGGGGVGGESISMLFCAALSIFSCLPS